MKVLKYGGNMYVIAIYDVNEKRVAKMLKLCRRFLHHIQNSVFEGEISEANIEALKIESKKILSDDDSFIIFMSRDKKWLDKTIIGAEKRSAGNFI